MATDMSKASQCNKILEYLRTHAVINTKIARELFRCERLASRINDLKDRGYKIGRNIITYKDIDGQNIRYAEYFLIEEAAG
jgi:hypothetical protein